MAKYRLHYANPVLKGKQVGPAACSSRTTHRTARSGAFLRRSGVCSTKPTTTRAPRLLSKCSPETFQKEYGLRLVNTPERSYSEVFRSHPEYPPFRCQYLSLRHLALAALSGIPVEMPSGPELWTTLLRMQSRWPRLTVTIGSGLSEEVTSRGNNHKRTESRGFLGNLRRNVRDKHFQYPVQRHVSNGSTNDGGQAATNHPWGMR